jgi:hypothetical protein
MLLYGVTEPFIACSGWESNEWLRQVGGRDIWIHTELYKEAQVALWMACASRPKGMEQICKGSYDICQKS